MRQNPIASAPASVLDDMPLRDVLDRIAEELASTAALIQAVEPHLAAAGYPAGDPRSVMALQGIDLAGQQISGLAEFLATLGRSIHEGYCVPTRDALDGVKLSEMKARLERRVEMPVAMRPKAVGDFEMF